MKTKTDRSAAASTSDAGSTKPTPQPKVIRDGDFARVTNWPAALEDAEVIAALKGFVYESYELTGEAKTGIYRRA
jgi:hypothetical protein